MITFVTFFGELPFVSARSQAVRRVESGRTELKLKLKHRRNNHT